MRKYLITLFLLTNLYCFSQNQSFYDPSLIFWLPVVNDFSQKDLSIYSHDVEMKSDEVIFDYDRKGKRGAYTFTGNFGSFIQKKQDQEFAYSTISICTWVKTTSTDKINRLVVLPTENGGQNYSLNINLSAIKTEDAKGKASIYFDPEDDKGAVSLLSKTNVADGKWHFIVGVINSDNKKMKIYVDGILEGEKSFNSKPKAGKIGKLQIGRHSEKYQEYLTGSLDDIMIFSRELSKIEVQLLAK